MSFLPFGVEPDHLKWLLTGAAAGGAVGGLVGKYFRRRRYRRKDFSDIVVIEVQGLYEKDGKTRLRVIPWGYVMQFPDIFKNEFLGGAISDKVKQHPGIVNLDNADDNSLMQQIIESHLSGNDIPGTMDFVMNRSPLTDEVLFVPTSYKELRGRHADVVGNVGMMRVYVINPKWVPKLIDKDYCARIVPDHPRYAKHGERLCEIAQKINGRIDKAVAAEEIGKALVDTRRYPELRAA